MEGKGTHSCAGKVQQRQRQEGPTSPSLPGAGPGTVGAGPPAEVGIPIADAGYLNHLNTASLSSDDDPGEKSKVRDSGSSWDRWRRVGQALASRHLSISGTSSAPHHHDEIHGDDMCHEQQVGEGEVGHILSRTVVRASKAAHHIIDIRSRTTGEQMKVENLDR